MNIKYDEKELSTEMLQFFHQLKLRKQLREQLRQRLFGVYGPTFLGIVATVAVLFVLTFAIDIMFKPRHGSEESLFLGLTFTPISVIIFIAVMRRIPKLSSDNKNRAYFLLGLASVSGALLIIGVVLALAGFSVSDEFFQRFGQRAIVSELVLVACFAICLPINIFIGFNDSKWQAVLQWMINFAIIVLGFSLLFFLADSNRELRGPWSLLAGLVCGQYLAWMVKKLLRSAAANPQIPSPGLAAHWVAAIVCPILFIVLYPIANIAKRSGTGDGDSVKQKEKTTPLGS